MIHLPKRLRDSFEKSLCPHCKKSLQDEGICGVGMREEKSKSGEQIVFCYEYHCVSCRKRSVFIGFPTNWQEFIGDMMEIANNSTSDYTSDDTDVQEEAEIPKKKKKKSGISSTEVEDLKQSLDSSVDLKDFLLKMGIVIKEQQNDDKGE